MPLILINIYIFEGEIKRLLSILFISVSCGVVLKCVADYNADGEINVLNLSQIVNFILGIYPKPR